MLQQLPEIIHQTAERYGATLVPFPKLDSMLIFIDGSNRKRILTSELLDMSADQLGTLFHGLANPPAVEMKSRTIVDYFIAQRRQRSEITGHFRGGER